MELENLLNKVSLTTLESLGSPELITVYSLLGLPTKRGMWGKTEKKERTTSF